jgi:hypothetical protein
MSNNTAVVREAQGTGRWFPGEEKTLRNMVSDYIDKAKVPGLKGRILCGISPHAGYVYSGKVAGFTFRALKDNAVGKNAPETVVVLGISHRAGFRGVAIMDGDSIHTPLGATPLDKDAATILAKDRPRLFMAYSPHESEHSAENQIPFVQVALPKAKLVVALVGDHDMKTLDELVAGLNELAKVKKIVVVASSDMLHDPDYDLVGKTDRKTLERVAALDYKAILADWSPDRQTFCGLMPVMAAMRFAEAQGCKAGTILHYRNNGDDDPTSRGRWVVGYGSAVFTGP